MKLFEIKKTPKWLLCESATEKAAHLEHIEDLIFNEGYLGAQKALNYIESIRSMLVQGSGKSSNITIKWDGAPSITCGIDPSDGKFFVGTKSVFAQGEPKICKTKRDIKKWYSERPGLADKLELCLKYLPGLGISGVIKGDLMFTASDLVNNTIDGENYLTFTPNTITYAVKADSALAKKMASAKLGIIFHTYYEGPDILHMNARFGFSVAGLNQSKNVWFDDAFYHDYTGIASLTPEENSNLQRGLGQAAITLRKITPHNFNKVLKTSATADKDSANTEFSKFVKPFINSLVNAGQPLADPTKFLKQFVSYYKGEQEKAIAQLKGGPDSKAAQARLSKIKEKEEFIADHSNTLLGVLAIYKKVIELKLIIIKKLTQIESYANTFIKTDTGYQVTRPEGFVAVGHDGGAVKLVDRLEFSHANANAVKNWKNT